MSKFNGKDNPKIWEDLDFLPPVGLKKSVPKLDPKTNKVDYWQGNEMKYYVISPDEEAVFSAYTTVDSNTVIAAEVVVVGTRPFYSIQDKYRKPILWKSSIIILPVKDSDSKIIAGSI